MREEAWGRPVADLEQSLRKALPDVQCWFPAVTPEGLHNPSDPYGSYVFLAAPVQVPRRGIPWVERVLKPAIAESELLRSVGRKPPMRVGDDVIFKKMPGTVVAIEAARYQVRVRLDSGHRLVWVDKEAA
jgi:hypothetical protein